MSKAPNDKKNLERDVKLRYSVQSGQSTIHGDTNYQVITQESQSFGFYQSTGQGARVEQDRWTNVKNRFLIEHT